MDNISNSAIEAGLFYSTAALVLLVVFRLSRLIRGIMLANQLLCLVDVIFCTVIVAVIY